MSCLLSFHPSLSLSLSHIWWTPLQYLTGGSVIKHLPANAGDTRDASSVYGSGRSPEVGNDNPHQCSCLENPMDRGAWGVIGHRAAESQTLSPRLYLSSTYSVSLYFCTRLLSSHFSVSEGWESYLWCLSLWILSLAMLSGTSALISVWVTAGPQQPHCLYRFTLFYWASQILCFLRLESLTQLCIEQACSLPLCHILSILAIFQAF